jgi:hypothetical protein
LAFLLALPAFVIKICEAFGMHASNFWINSLMVFNRQREILIEKKDKMTRDKTKVYYKSYLDIYS